MTKKLSKHQKKFENKEPGFHILQSRQARFHNIISPVPAIIWVLSGTKRLSTDRESREVSSDYFVMIPENQSMTIENIPHGNKPYEARVLAFERETFESAYKRLSISEEQRRKTFQTTAATKNIAEAFLRARTAFGDASDLPPSILKIRCEEVVLWLAEAGACLPWSHPASFSDRVRNVIAKHPSHSWTSAEVGTELAVSEATLRRKLRAERTSFKIVLLELRLAFALTYLQTTNWGLAKISSSVGYKSQTRFSTRFQERFDIHPGKFRNSQS